MSTLQQAPRQRNQRRQQTKSAPSKPLRQQSQYTQANKASKQSNKDKKQRKEDVSRKRVYKTPSPSNTVIVPPQESLYQSQIQVNAPWNPLALKEMMAAFTGYFLSKSIAGTADFVTKLPSFYDGMFTQWVEFTKIASGTPALERRLRIIHDLANAFSQKTVSKHTYSKVSFGWTDVTAPTAPTYPTGWNTWDFIVPDIDNNDYLAPANVYAPVASDKAYSSYMSQIQAISSARAHFLQTVQDDSPSPLKNDPSAFAKVYSYLGLTPAHSGGFYNDCENEVDILAPILSHNVEYPSQQQDDRVAEKLTTNTGGPAFNLAPLLQCFPNWFNKNRIDVKFLDFYEVVYQLLYWYLGAVQLALAAGTGSAGDYVLPFSFQDFCIVVRQALMSSFKDQWMVQFCGPLAYDNTGVTNFLPFQILGNCYGNDSFKRFLGPSLLAENLSMLQTVAYKYNKKKSQINETVCVPCWGFFNDAPAEFVIPGQEVPTPLFGIPTGSQKNINLVDCTYNSNTYVNVNGSYYFDVLENWNNALTSLKAYVNVCDISNLSPPHSAALLQTTRVFGYVPRQQLKQQSAIKKMEYPCLKPISNLKSYPSKKDVKDKKPTLPNPTSVNQISIEEIYATYPVQKEMHEFMTYLILPAIRLDPNSANDVLNKTMYQTITYEGLSQPQNANSLAPAYLSRLQDAANMSIEGQGKIASSSITTLLNHLAANGNGGVLSALLGGFAKSLIPGADGIIDTIATALPF